MFVILKLSDPPAGSEGWPVDEIWELRRVLQETIDEVDPEFDLPWYVRFVPFSAVESDGDESVEVDSSEF